MLVEFALTITIFLALVFGTIDLARWLFAIVSIGEATREGARVAVVCDLNDSAIRDRMRTGLVSAAGGSISITYLPSGCFGNAASGSPVCAGVSVSVAGYSVPAVSPFLPAMTLPAITTFLSRESLTSLNNARCD